jgi:hypothetical protein
MVVELKEDLERVIDEEPPFDFAADRVAIR